MTHIPNYEDLVTTHEQTRAGFLAMAFEKNRSAVPFVEEARVLKRIASSVAHPKELLRIAGIRNALLSAAGTSDKAMNHFTESDKEAAIVSLIDKYLVPAGDKFIDELVYRFLLIRGDSLGGKMRNIAGRLGEWKFTRTLISTLSLHSIPFQCRKTSSTNWIPGNIEETDIEHNIKGLYWETDGKPRTLLYNLTIPIIKKNVDLSLLGCPPKDSISAIGNPREYLALGELKGGIDPAGADEHWKTANSALNRIRTRFQNSVPFTFFIGAAIATDMAKEIFSQIKNQTLHMAANLNNDKQLVDLCKWLIEI